MGNYNPHAPTILGEEWVPIRDEYTEVSTLQTSVEYGHQFTTAAAATLDDARFYVGEMPANTSDPFYLTAIYQAGTEADSGPIRSVIIPVDSVATTGTTQAVGSPPNGATALLTPVVDYYYSLPTSSVSAGLGIVWMQYNTAAYSQLLQGKRIIAVNILLGASAPLPVTPYIGVTTDATTVDSARVNNFSNAYSNISRVAFGGETGRFRLGNLAINNSTALLTNEYLPWTYDDINKFDASSGSPNYIAFSVGSYFGDEAGVTGTVLWYSGMEVIYCEEKRLFVAGWNSRIATGGINYGANVGRVRSWQAKALSPSLSAGSYTMTISSLNTGDLTTDIVDAPPQINACRELYAMPSQPGWQINIPDPPEDNLGATLTIEQTSILPQLSLHTSSAALTEPHVYGRQVAAQVWGTRTVDQDIFNSFSASASYPWVRFYARRFGDTTAPLVLAGTGGATGSATISVGEFDALPEIVDGWKEITLVLDPVATLGATASSTYRWSANAEAAGNRWEILGCAAPALSGLPGNLFGQATQQLSNGTYYAPNGGTYVLTWMPQGVTSPYISGAADDTATDAVLMFALAPLAITGFGVEAAVQELVGVGLQCDVDPCGIASAINYNRITWPAQTFSDILYDSFTRVSTGWGTADTGQTYTDAGGTVPGNYVVNGSEGTHVLDGATNLNRSSTISGTVKNLHARAKIATNNAPSAGASVRGGIIGHYVDANNYDFVDLHFATSGQTEIVITTRVAGTNTTNTNVSAGAYGANQFWYLDVDFNDTVVRAKAWPVDGTEPTEYQAEATAAFSIGGYGVRSIRSAGNTNTDAVISYDDFTVGPSTWNFGSYELQRSDQVSDWETIMLASDPSVTGFSDYEARVGLESSYRIRAVDLYGFYGDWSSEVSITLPSPGATGGDCLAEGHLLLFTSNESQAGAYNLAYAPIWESRVTEDFDFPESSFIQLQPMYNKDFFTAFRPTERGGVRFQRDILVQAAAISPETLEDFTDLRDMAWADLSYVCVRDEEGNRWFATVAVPSGRVQLNRTLYMAVVDIVEVTDTPTQVDP